MKLMHKGSVAIALAALLVAALAPTAAAKKPGKEVPLKGNFTGVATEFSGNFSHLGAFNGVVDLDPSDGTDDTVWVAANGDTVTNRTTSFVPAFDGTYEQTIEITGGTGRFEGATGSATITGNFDFTTLVYDGTLRGSISQPGRGN